LEKQLDSKLTPRNTVRLFTELAGAYTIYQERKDEDEIYGCNQARERRQKCGLRERYGYETIREISMLTVLYHEHVGRMKELE
jgi:hypothetical protein